MTVPTGTFQTHQAIGNKEDVSDIIWDIDPDDTPFISMIGREKVHAVMPEWQTDTIAVPASNAQVEGDDVATLTAVPTVRLRNYVQTLAKVVRVSETQRNVDHYGRNDELEYQTEKRMREVKTDLELAAIGNQQSTAGTAAVARTMASYEAWCATNKTTVGSNAGGATTPGYSSGTVAAATDATTAGTLTEAALRNVIQLCYTAGGNPEILMCGPATKQKVAQAFTGLATRFRDVGPKQKAQIIAGADWYISDFGQHKLVPNRVVARASSSRDRNILAIDPKYWKVGVLQDWKIKDLAKTGLSERKMISGEFTLLALNEKSSGKVTDINPSL
jgi:hypothetical protein